MTLRDSPFENKSCKKQFMGVCKRDDMCFIVTAEETIHCDPFQIYFFISGPFLR